MVELRLEAVARVGVPLQQADAGLLQVGKIEQASRGLPVAVDAVESPQNFHQRAPFGGVMGGKQRALGPLVNQFLQLDQLRAEGMVPLAATHIDGKSFDGGQLLARRAAIEQPLDTLARGLQLFANRRIPTIGSGIPELGREGFDAVQSIVGGSRPGGHAVDVQTRAAHGGVGSQHGFFELERRQGADQGSHFGGPGGE